MFFEIDESLILGSYPVTDSQYLASAMEELPVPHPISRILLNVCSLKILSKGVHVMEVYTNCNEKPYHNYIHLIF